VEERRRYPRANVDIELRTGSDRSPRGRVRTVDLSASGVAYESPSWIEPFTKFEMIFVFPPFGERHEKTPVRVEAVVMRTEPETPDDTADGYRVACSFTGIQNDDRALIEQYVDHVRRKAKAGA